MGGKREIKCQACKEWTLWRGDINDRCLNCGEFLQKEAYTEQVEKSILSQVKTENDILFIRPGDTVLVQRGKKILQVLRRLAKILQIAFVIIVTFLLWIISMLPG